MDFEKNTKITILFLAAESSDAVRPRLGKEIREIREKIQLSALKLRFDLEERMAIRSSDISQALLNVSVQIVHFSGHGNSNGLIYIEDKTGNKLPVNPESLAALFSHLRQM